MEERGTRPISKVLKLGVVPAGASVAERLQIRGGTPVVELQRLRFVEAEPIVLVTSYLPHALCPGLEKVDFREQSLYAYLQNSYGLVIASGHRYIEAVTADEDEAELLQVDVGTSLIHLESVSYLDDNTPIEYFHALHRGDRTRLEVALVRVREQGQTLDTMGTSEQDLPGSNGLI